MPSWGSAPLRRPAGRIRRARCFGADRNDAADTARCRTDGDEAESAGADRGGGGGPEPAERSDRPCGTAAGGEFSGVRARAAEQRRGFVRPALSGNPAAYWSVSEFSG